MNYDSNIQFRNKYPNAMGKYLINATWTELFKLRLEQDDFLSSAWEIIVSKDGKYNYY